MSYKGLLSRIYIKSYTSVVKRQTIQIKLTDPLLGAFDNSGKKKLLQNFTSGN